MVNEAADAAAARRVDDVIRAVNAEQVVVGAAALVRRLESVCMHAPHAHACVRASSVGAPP